MPSSGLPPLAELTVARFRLFFREPAALFWTFVFPVLLATALGIAFRDRPPQSPRVAVVESGPASERVLAALQAAPDVEAQGCEAGEVRSLLRSARVDLVVLAEEGATPPRQTYRYDPARPEARQARLLVDDTVQRGLGRRDVAEARDVPYDEPGGRYIDFLIPGLIGLNVMSSSMWGIGYAIVQDRRRRLLKRLAATPMRRSHFLLSHMLARLAFLVLEVGALLLAGSLLFGVTLRGSLLGFAVVALAGALAFMGIALAVAARTDNTEVASGLMNAVMLPMWVLSGTFFSYERFPEALWPLLRLLPLTAFNEAARALLNEGQSVLTTLPQLGVLGAWSLLGFVLALRLFRWQ